MTETEAADVPLQPLAASGLPGLTLIGQDEAGCCANGVYAVPTSDAEASR